METPEETALLRLVMALIEKLAEKGVLDAKDARQIIKRSLETEKPKRGKR